MMKMMNLKNLNIKISVDNMNTHIECRIKKRITRVMDKSATGKTYFFNALAGADDAAKLGKPIVTLDGEAINVIRIQGTDDYKLPLDKIEWKFRESNSLIIIDEADRLLALHRELCDIILENESSYFILMSRIYFAELPLNIYNNAVLNLEGSNLKLKYYEDLFA